MCQNHEILTIYEMCVRKEKVNCMNSKLPEMKLRLTAKLIQSILWNELIVCFSFSDKQRLTDIKRLISEQKVTFVLASFPVKKVTS